MNKNTKAMAVTQAYDDAQWDNESSGTCYLTAVHTARELGGVVIANSNDETRIKSDYPIVTFEFDDGSSVEVTIGSAYL